MDFYLSKLKLKLNRTSLFALAILCAPSVLSAHGSSSLDFLRSTGKIYTVVGCILIIFIGIVWYLVRMDKKLTKLENQIKNGK